MSQSLISCLCIVTSIYQILKLYTSKGRNNPLTRISLRPGHIKTQNNIYTNFFLWPFHFSNDSVYRYFLYQCVHDEMSVQYLSIFIILFAFRFTSLFMFFRATIISRMQGNVSHPDVGNVALPGVMRGGVSGENTISVGSMSSAQHGQVSSEMHHVHGNRQVCLLTVIRPIHTPVISLPLHLFTVVIVFI